MAKQTINIGSTANDGSGDSLRDAGQKINSNFTELYNNGLDGSITQAAFNRANSANVLAQSSFNQANSANVLAQSAFDKANTNILKAVVVINTETHNAANTEEVLLCDPNAAGTDIGVTLSSNVSNGKSFTIKNINPGGYSVNVAATTIEHPVTKSFVSQVVMANTGEVYTWIAHSGIYRHIG